MSGHHTAHWVRTVHFGPNLGASGDIHPPTNNALFANPKLKTIRLSLQSEPDGRRQRVDGLPRVMSVVLCRPVVLLRARRGMVRGGG